MPPKKLLVLWPVGLVSAGVGCAPRTRHALEMSAIPRALFALNACCVGALYLLCAALKGWKPAEKKSENGGGYMQRTLIAMGIAILGIVAGFAFGDVIASCRGDACIAPWQWWRTLKDPDQAAWLQAIGTFSAIVVALASPWVALWANRAGERARAERLGVQLAIALTPVLGEVERRLRAVRMTIANFVGQDDNPLRWQWISAMRIPEIEILAQFRGSFTDLGGLGFSLQSVTGTLQSVERELASFDRAGPGIVAVADIDNRLTHIDITLALLLSHVTSLHERIGTAANARSLRPLMNPVQL